MPSQQLSTVAAVWRAWSHRSRLLRDSKSLNVTWITHTVWGIDRIRRGIIIAISRANKLDNFFDSVSLLRPPDRMDDLLSYKTMKQRSSILLQQQPSSPSEAQKALMGFTDSHLKRVDLLLHSANKTVEIREENNWCCHCVKPELCYIINVS